MKVKTIPSVLLGRDGRRMDSAPYMSGSQETKLLIERLDAPKAALRTLTHGYDGGIYNGPKFARNWVQAPEHGVPFLNSSDMLQADLTNLPYLRKSDAHSPRLSYLRLAPGMILISCTGTIGRMVYARPDMDGIWSSQHIMKVVPDPARIPPGYLYAFLSSKYGVPMIVGGTYGSIIQSIEPHHIADLPVPRLGEAVEQRAHALVEEAADARSKASSLRRSAIKEFEQLFGFQEQFPTQITAFFVTSVSSNAVRRLDANHFNPASMKATELLANAGKHQTILGDICDVFSTNIFKRIHVEDPAYGYAYFSGSELFQIAPTPRGYLSRKAPGIREYVVYTDWLLIQDAGQLGGLIGQLTRVPANLNGVVVSNHLMRVVPRSRIDAGYLFAVLSSPLGYRAITRNAFGSSIPQLDPAHISTIKIPWPDDIEREKFAAPVLNSWDLDDRATNAELEAVTLVERTIEGFV